MILTCYNFEFFKPEDLCLFAVFDTICDPAEIDFFVHFVLKNLTSDGNNSNSLYYAAIVSTAERFLVSKVSKHTRPEIRQQVATVNHLCMVDHVKFLMHLRLYGMLQHNHWGIDGWAPLQNIGARAPGLMYTVILPGGPN